MTRAVAAVVGALVAALVVTACTSSVSPGARVASVASHAIRTSSSARRSAPVGAVAFSACMRARGVSQYPDPDSAGVLPKVGARQLGVSTLQFDAAEHACAHLLRSSDTEVQLTLTGMRDFARCMRAHGVQNWPDPTVDSDGQPVFDLRARINPDTPQIDTKSGQCAYLLQPPPGQDGTFLCNGIGEDGCHHYG